MKMRRFSTLLTVMLALAFALCACARSADTESAQESSALGQGSSALGQGSSALGQEGPALDQESPTYDQESPTLGQGSLTLEEYLEKGGEEWFLTGKKEYPVQAMMVSKETSFHNDLEEVDYTVTDDGVTVVLKGTVGEMWASKLPSVQSSYTKPGGDAIADTDFAEKDVFIDIVSIPAPGSCYAMFVPNKVSVKVETAWGDVLHANHPNADHGDGDYIVCRAGEDGEPDLSDVWVVNGLVFPKTYDARGSTTAR